MRFKKLAAMLAAAVTVSAMAVPAAATTPWEAGANGLSFQEVFHDDYSWGYTVSWSNPPTGAVVIPEKWGNKVVDSISPQSLYPKPGVTSISIPKTIVYIKDADAKTSAGIGYDYGKWNPTTSDLKEIILDEENTAFSLVDGILYDKDKTRLIMYPSKRANTVLNNIPNTVRDFEEGAFMGSSLTEVNLPEGIEYMPKFWGCMGLTEINVPASVEDISSVSYNSGIKTINVDTKNQNFKSVEGVVFSKDGTKLVEYPFGRTEKSYNIPAEVTAIGYEALGSNALEEIIIPDTVQTIDHGAFEYSNKLKTVKLPAGLTKISCNTFGSCLALENLTIPVSVTEIEEGAFDGCEQNNLKITYTGTKEQFKAITVGEYGNDILSKAQITCTDGVIGATDNPVDDTIIQSPSVSENENGNKEYTPEVKKNVSFNEDVMNDVKKIRVETPSEAFVDSVSLQVAPISASSARFSVDIKFVKSDGSKVQPSKPVTVKIPVPESMQSASKIFVYHTDGSGAKTKVESSVETIDGKKYVVFTASSFSVYTLTTQAESGDEENLNTTTSAAAVTAAPAVPNIRPAAPETAPEATASETSSQSQGTENAAPADTDTDKNQATGAMIAVVPAFTAMAGVILSKKRK